MANSYFTKAIFLFAFSLMSFSVLEAQEKGNPFTKVLRDGKNAFTAQSYTSTTVSMRQLTDDYSVRIKTDSLIGLLPYFGGSYAARISVTDGGLKFTSLKLDYSFVEKKKHKCEITIRPKDDRTVQVLSLTVFSDSGA